MSYLKSQDTYPKITKFLKQIIVGKILGDGHLEKNGTHSYRLKIEHSIAQKDYVDWCYEHLKYFCSQPPKTRLHKDSRGKICEKYTFQTRSFENFKFFADQFYSDGKKTIPRRIIQKLLTPLSIAVWFMDDGSVKSKNTNGRILNTQGFSRTEVEKLCQALNAKFDLHAQLRKQKEGWQILFPQKMH